MENLQANINSNINPKIDTSIVSKNSNEKMILAKKYRPKKFSDLIGQDINIQILQNIIKNQRKHHAYLLTGTRGIGKTTIARIIAKAVNCEHVLENSDPCCSCNSCIELDNSSNSDIIEIDAASNTGVDNIREIIDNANFVPICGKYKVYIIDEVHMLSKSAFAAMLKILEEPPQHIIFILATTDYHKIPITIISRCLQLKLNNISIDNIILNLKNILLKEDISSDEESLLMIANNAKGSMRDALSLLDAVIAFANTDINHKIIIDKKQVATILAIPDDDIIFNIFDHIVTKNINELYTIINNLDDQGLNLQYILEQIHKILLEVNMQQLLLKQKSSNNQLSKSETLESFNHRIQLDKHNKIIKYAKQISITNIQLYFEICTLGLEQMLNSNNQVVIFTMTVLRMLSCHIADAHETQEIMSDIHTNILTTTDTIHSSNNNIHDKSYENTLAIINNETKNTNTVDNNIANTTEEITNVIESIADTQSKTINNNIIETEQKINDLYASYANWYNVIIALQNELMHLYPFLENSSLINMQNNRNTINLVVIIDARYQASFDEHAQSKISDILSKYFEKTIKIIVDFKEKIQDSVKAKIQECEAIERDLIHNELNKNKKITSILDSFHGIITNIQIN